MYYRQPEDSAPSKSVGQLQCVAAFEQTSDAALEQELTRSSFTSSDLMQLNLDWLIDNDVLTESKVHRDDVEPNRLTIEDLELTSVDSTYFTDDSLIPANQSDSLFMKEACDGSFELTNEENISIDHLLEDLGLIASSRYEQTTTNIAGLVENDSARVQTFDVGDSLRNNCSSPSSSSGYDSDFNSPYDDYQFPFSDEVGFENLSEQPFTELFPALYD
jgi:hypothetical protein